MTAMLARIRPTVLLIAAMLTAICLVDIAAIEGPPTVGLAAIGALAAIAREVITDD